jgi:hypothetical protein
MTRKNLMPSYTGFVRSFVGQLGGGSHSFTASTVTQQNVQDATVDWFSQFTTDQQGYYNTYESLVGTTADSSTAASSASADSSGFSLDSFLNSLFSDGSETFNADAYASEPQTGSQGDTSATVSSASFANLWKTKPRRSLRRWK